MMFAVIVERSCFELRTSYWSCCHHCMMWTTMKMIEPCSSLLLVNPSVQGSPWWKETSKIVVSWLTSPEYRLIAHSDRWQLGTGDDLRHQNVLVSLTQALGRWLSILSHHHYPRSFRICSRNISWSQVDIHLVSSSTCRCWSRWRSKDVSRTQL